MRRYDALKTALKSKDPHVYIHMGRRTACTINANIIQQLTKFQKLKLVIYGYPKIDLEEKLILFSKLPNLVSLSIVGSKIEKIPPSINLLTSLEELDFSQNKITQIPETISNLKKLKKLNLSDNELSNLPEALDQLSSLETLVVNNNQLKKLPTNFALLSNLTTLHAANNHLEQLAKDFFTLQALSDINLNNNSFTSFPKDFSTLPHLEEFSFWGNQHNVDQDFYPFLQKLKAPEQLKLVDVSYVSDNISVFKNLKSLHFTSATFSSLPTAIYKLPNLEYLHFESCKTLQTLPNSLPQCPNIKMISFNNCSQLDEEQAYEVIFQCPLIERYSFRFFRNWNLTRIPHAIKAAPYLKTLELSGIRNKMQLESDWCYNTSIKELLIDSSNRMAIELLEQIVHLPALEVLSFRGVDKGDHSKLFELRTLKKLILNFTYFENPAYPWQNFSQLEELELVNGRYVPEGVQYLSQLKKLKLTGGFGDSFPTFIDQLINLEELYFSNISQNTLSNDPFVVIKSLSKLKRLHIHNLYLSQDCADLTQLQQLEEVDLGIQNSTLSSNQVVEYLTTLPRLKKLFLRVSEEGGVPTNLHQLQHLEQLNISIHRRQLHIPVELALLRPEISLHLSSSSMADEIRNFFENPELSSYTDLQKMLNFALLLKKFDETSEILPSPFEGDFHPNNMLLYLSSKLTGMKQTELKEKFKEFGIKTTNRFSSKITHAVITNSTKPSILTQLITQEIPLANEAHLRTYLWSEEKPFLMEATATKELTDNVLTLIFSNDPTNQKLALQMILGGGANHRIKAYLIALYFFHLDKTVRATAKKPYAKYISTTLQTQLKEVWRISQRKDAKFDIIARQIAKEDIHLGEFFMVCTLICKPRYQLNYLESINANTFTISHPSIKRLPDSIRLYKSLKGININQPNGIGFEQLMELLPEFPVLQSVHINSKDATIDITPLLLTSRLTDIYVNAKELIIGDLSKMENSKLKYLELSTTQGNSFSINVSKTPELETFKLYNFPDMNGKIMGLNKASFLREIFLINLGLNTYPKGLFEQKFIEQVNISRNNLPYLNEFSKLPRLRKLIACNNNIKEFPGDLLACQELYDLNLSHNQISLVPRVAYDNIKWLSLNHNPVEEK